MTTIRDELESVGFRDHYFDALPVHLQDALQSFADWDASSHCGTECVLIMALAGRFADAVDESVRFEVWITTVAAMAVVCVG